MTEPKTTASPFRLDLKTWHTIAVCLDRDPLLYLGLWVVLRCAGMSAWEVLERLAMASVTIAVVYLLWPGSDEE